MKKAFCFSTSVICIFFTLACGSPYGKVDIEKGSMPEGGTFDGVYHSQAYGRMEITVNGADASGLYEAERFHGRISGIVEGDLMTFEWIQWNEDLNGKYREKKGRGYFKYIVKMEGSQANPKPVHWIEGEWGYGENNSGNTWDAVKLAKKSKKRLQAHENFGPRGDMGDDYESASGFGGEAAQPGSESGEGTTATPHDSIQRSSPESEGAGEGLDDLF